MNVGESVIDHIVYAVPDLEVAMQVFENQTGVKPIFGGYHTTQGTKNALVYLGKRCYLEFLAIDKDNKDVKSPRWMGIDWIEKPQITRWAIHSNHLEEDCRILKQYHPQMGEIREGQRAKVDGSLLKWKLTMPLANPKVEIAPFMIDWQHSESHPTATLVPECQLLNITFNTSNHHAITQLFNNLKIEAKVNRNQDTTINITLQTPKGIIRL